jgi:hypothetical protein
MTISRLVSPARRALLATAAAGPACAAWPRIADALMAGAPPDSPQARVDPNLPTSPWAGVVAVRVRGGTFSGALIHRRMVLTAAHVVAGAPPDVVEVQVNASAVPLRIAAAQVHVHPGWRGFTKPFAFDDLAIVELEDEVPRGAPIYPIFPYVPPQGVALLLVGYGASGHGSIGPAVGADPAVKRIGQNRIDRVIPRPDAPDAPSLFLYDFDGPDESTNVFDGPTLGNAVETSAAGGDSGAPAFVMPDGIPRIVGVLTFVTDILRPGTPLSTFGASGGGVLAAAAQAWLAERIAVP